MDSSENLAQGLFNTQCNTLVILVQVFCRSQIQLDKFPREHYKV